ncbi:MAG: glutaredoxin family protein [Actinomycetota bacterium]|nr:glutaredoxin family protein [Actinomycetota bacterium]
MACARRPVAHDATGGVRDRGRTRVGGDRDARPVPIAELPRVRLYSARDCHLCDAARRVLERVRGDTPFELEEIDITANPELERRYREKIPVVAVSGNEVFTYFVPPDALRRRLREAGATS